MKKKSRRNILGFIGLATFSLLQFCRKKRPIDSQLPPEKNSSIIADRDRETALDPTFANPPPATSEKPVKAISDHEIAPCTFSLSAVELKNIKEVNEALEPRYKLYGQENSALFVIDLPKYQDRSLKEIYLAYDNGQLIAQKVVDDLIDTQENGFLRYQIFEHLQLDLSRKVVILYQTYLGLFKYTIPNFLDFEIAFNNKKVLPANTRSYSPINYSHQAFPLIEYHLQNTNEITEDNTDLWHIISDDYQLTTKETLQDFIVCDLMGQVLENYGEKFTEFIKYQHLILYKPFNQFYVRTFFRLI